MICNWKEMGGSFITKPRLKVLQVKGQRKNQLNYTETWQTFGLKVFAMTFMNKHLHFYLKLSLE